MSIQRRRSLIWKISREHFNKLIKESQTYKEVLRKMGRHECSGGGYRTLKQRIVEDNIDVTHIENNSKKFRGTKRNKIPLQDILICNSTYQNNGNLKKRLLKENIIKNECSKCELKSVWCGESISLQLDHINGDSKDNRLENLRILCPNCHSQTNTYAGRNAAKKIKSNFCSCGAKKGRNSLTCKKCIPSPPEKIQWPATEDLQKLLLEKPTSIIARELGVSDSAIGKRAKKLGLEKPSRGFWSGQRKSNPHFIRGRDTYR